MIRTIPPLALSSLEHTLLSCGEYTVCGVPLGHDALVLSEIAALFPRRCVLHLASSEERAKQMCATLSFFAKDLKVVFFPPWDCLPYDRASPGPHRVAQRVKALQTLAFSQGNERVIVVTTPSALTQRVRAPEDMRRGFLHLTSGQGITLEAVISFLQRVGYTRTGAVLDGGDYAVRGGILDVFSPGEEEGLRIDFFGHAIDGLRTFDPKTQRSTGQRKESVLRPFGEVFYDTQSIAHFRKEYTRLKGGNTLGDPLYEAVSAGHRAPGVEHWLPLFNPMSTLFSYLPKETLVICDEGSEEALKAHWEDIAQYFEARREALTQKTPSLGAPYVPLPPRSLYILEPEWRKASADKTHLVLHPFQVPNALLDVGGRAGKRFYEARVIAKGGGDGGGYKTLYHDVVSHVCALQSEGKKVLLAASSSGSRERLAVLLSDYGFTKTQNIAEGGALDTVLPDHLGLIVLDLEKGFETPTLAVLSEQDIFGDRMVRRVKKTKNPSAFLSELSTLSPGDYIVHIDHGVGQFEGLKTLEVQGIRQECFHLTYAGGDRLFLPIENGDLIRRFGGEDGTVALDKLGGTAWALRKARLKKDLLAMASGLMETAAARTLQTLDAIVPDPVAYAAFCARFPYAETEDQLSAIEDILTDLARGHPMDRLVCGDVGFGKTEAALRAAFCVAMSGRQVAVVVPTTLLARQHYAQFSKRFEGFPLRIATLSRLISRQDTKATLKELAEGSCDIVIGTHALLGESVSFRDLGLVIIDEEQHFGVTHKERLKALKHGVHVLTLTATPIPRTLQLSLSGVRGLSLITTPPVDRLPVRTLVSSFDPLVIREYVLRELYRGGQSFFVVPRISDLDDMADFFKTHIPEVKVAIAHGRLSPSALDKVMTAFYDRAYDVLLATTIVESGLDVPTANTLIVHRADRFGLAQLYQIRGRVGRSKQRAYALLTTPAGQRLGPGAERRLELLQSLDTLGAGFTLASHDLDLRGAGNLLGDAQSGHVREVGFELYQTMLEETIAELKAKEEGREKPQQTQWSVQINLGVCALIPQSYIEEEEVRLALYRRLGDMRDEEEISAFAIELRDRFGPFPQDVSFLLRVMNIKILCRKTHIESLDVGPKGVVIGFREGRFPRPEALLAWITKRQNWAKVRPDSKMVLLKQWATKEERLSGIFALLQDIEALLTA